MQPDPVPYLMIFIFLMLSACHSHSQRSQEELLPAIEPTAARASLIRPEGQSLATRFLPPPGFERPIAGRETFAGYLRQLALKPHTEKVRYYDGRIKPRSDVYLAVVDLDVGDRDLQQCADAIMRLRGEYLFRQKRFDEIRFDLTNGFDMRFDKWRQGFRIRVQRNKVSWVKSKAPSQSYAQFRSFMNMVFAYAGTLSLARELKPVPISDIAIGDVLIQGGSPGHAVIVVDLAENAQGEKVFMLAQSYMPAQDIQILQNPAKGPGDPWYGLPEGEEIHTPEWRFTIGDLRRF